MDDLLKEAIADAKAVRETALQNAKMALEEAFTPRLKSMLSKKIQSEDGYDMEEDDEMEDEEEMEVEPEVEPEEIPEEEGEEEAEAEAELEDEEDAEEEMEEEGVIEIDGVKYAPVVSEEEDEDADVTEQEDEEEADEEDEADMEEVDELDLEAILRELEEEAEEDGEEVSESEEEAEASETVEESEEAGEEAETVEEAEEVSEAEEAEEAEEVEEATEVEESDEVNEEVEEEIDLEEILNALREDEGSDSEADLEEATTRITHLEKEVTEHRDAVKILRSKLNEVNLLNSKLLFTNKLFRAFGLNNDQKMKVVETFDRAKSLREVKLVYSTLAETFGHSANEIKESKRIKGTASKPVASTKSEKQEIITESDDMKARFKKLANIL